MSDDTTSRVPEISQRLDAVTRCFRRCEPMLVGWLTEKFRDPETARDIAQDAFLRVWRFAQNEPVENPQALLFKTAANLAVNEFKSRRRVGARATQLSADDEDPVLKVPCESPSPEQTTSARRDAAVSLAVIDGLPDKVRRAFIMNRFEDKTYAEIADAMSVSVSSVEKYIITALRTLRDVLEREDSTGRNVVPFRNYNDR